MKNTNLSYMESVHKSGRIWGIAVACVLFAFPVALSLIFGTLPGILGEIPYLRIGIPAVLSVYFDIFSGCLQAYIFAVLTMLYVAGGFPKDEYEARKRRRAEKKLKKQAGGVATGA